MSTKEKVLQMLECNNGNPLSGAAMAEKIGVSRNAVWKAVSMLKKAGYEITGVTNIGYSLDNCRENDILSVQGITAHLSNLILDENIKIYECVESTNIIAKELAAQGAAHGTVVIAERQSAGRGRYGRLFHSPNGGIYMSIVLHTADLPFNTPTLVTAHAAAAVCKAIETLTDNKPQIKWVNDIFVNNRKICGISADAVVDFVSGAFQWVVVGIGINFSEPQNGFPPELADIAGAIFTAKEHPTITRNRLIAETLKHLLDCENFSLIEYKIRLMHIGERVIVKTNPEYEAVAIDLDDTGGLIVKKDNGETATLSSGEISIR
jgi:BirA family biotin operon repressor/biotin-[acetyl-CoA-carboxylase] ligase